MSAPAASRFADRAAMCDYIAGATLGLGKHSTYNAGHCAMELVAYVAGEPHTDHPECASPLITACCINLNDTWLDPAYARWVAPGLLDRFKAALCEVVGTRTTPVDEVTRGYLAWDWLVRTYTPAWLRLAGATRPELIAEAERLEQLPEIVDASSAEVVERALASARSTSAAAWDAARAAARAAASAAARAAAWDAASAAASAAARAAAWDAAWAAARAAARAAAYERGEAALRATVATLQESALDLVRRMCQVGRPAGAEAAP